MNIAQIRKQAKISTKELKSSNMNSQIYDNNEE